MTFSAAGSDAGTVGTLSEPTTPLVPASATLHLDDSYYGDEPMTAQTPPAFSSAAATVAAPSAPAQVPEGPRGEAAAAAVSEPQLFLQSVTNRKYEAPSTEGGKVAPQPRFGHTAVVHENDMIVYGGRNSECLSDIWSFNFVSRQWRELEQTAEEGCRPCARAGHTSVLHRGKMYIFGGVGNRDADNWLNDTWAFDLETKQWEHIQHAGASPKGRKGHTAVYNKGSMFVFGGGQDDRTLWSDLWEFKLDDRTWVERDLTGVSPMARMYHVAVLLPGDKMVMFGGRAHTAAGFLNDVLEVSLTPGAATSHVLEHSPTGTAPAHRMCSTAVYHNHTVAVFTGGSFSYLNDSHQLDLNKMHWSPIDDGMACGAVISNTHTLTRTHTVTFGGRTRPTTVKWKNTVMTFGGCVHVNGYASPFPFPFAIPHTTMHTPCRYVNDFVEIELEPMSLKQRMRQYILENGVQGREGLPQHIINYVDG